MALIFSNIQNMMQFISMSQILVWLVEIMCTELLQMNFTFIFVCTMLKLNILWDAIMLLDLIFDSVCRYEIVKNYVSIFISLVKIARKSLLKDSLIIAFSENFGFTEKMNILSWKNDPWKKAAESCHFEKYHLRHFVP